MAGPSTRNNVKATTLEDEGKASSPVPLTALPANAENPFENPFCDSDMVLVVEGQKLHVHKATISMLSPVFYKMFHGDFLESGAQEVEIKDTSYDAMRKFLRQMYPVYCSAPIHDDRDLADILPLADFYQVDHIRLKCEDYIGCQARSLVDQRQLNGIQANRIMLYVLFCERFRLRNHLKTVLNTASKLTVKEMTENSRFSSLVPATQTYLLKTRCQTTQTAISNFVKYFDGLDHWYDKERNCSKCLKNIGQVTCHNCLGKGMSECFNFNYK